MKKWVILAILGAMLFPASSYAAEAPHVINSVYQFWWNRTARADEIQFHQIHGTSIQRLEDWVRSIRENLNVDGRYQISDLEGHTVSKPRHAGGEFYLIQNGERHRVYDYPTAIAYGLNWGDRIGLPVWSDEHLNYVLNAFPEGEPLQFGEGPYADYVHEMWHDGRTEVTEESDYINELITSAHCYLTDKEKDTCTGWHSPGTHGQLMSLFDWTFLNTL